MFSLVGIVLIGMICSVWLGSVGIGLVSGLWMVIVYLIVVLV